MPRCLLPGVLALLLSAAAFGAEPAEPTQPADEEATAEAGAEAPAAASADDVDAAMAEEIRAAEAAAAAAPPAESNEPFVPSVQISEDLSVSFPVDI